MIHKNKSLIITGEVYNAVYTIVKIRLLMHNSLVTPFLFIDFILNTIYAINAVKNRKLVIITKQIHNSAEEKSAT